MLIYNKKVGNYKSYYNLYLSTCISNNEIFNNNIDLHNLKLNSKKRRGTAVFIMYSIFYKKNIYFLSSASHVLRSKRLKSNNFNQAILMEGSFSSKKCTFSFSLNSIINTIDFPIYQNA